MKLAAIGLVICVSAVSSCGPKNEPAPAAAPAAPEASKSGSVLSGTLEDDTLVAHATVTKIDRKTRKVTLQRPDGHKFSIVAGPEIRNLDQVKTGDVVRLQYYQSVAYEVHKPGTAKPGITASTDVTRSNPGEKPGGSVTETVTVRMTITAINKKRAEATLLGPDGVSNVVQVRNPSNLDKVEVGDVVDLTYTEALGVAVEKASKR
jgi:hypothetical protein